MTKLILYVYYKHHVCIECMSDGYGGIDCYNQNIILDNLKIISDEKTLDAFLFDKHTQINEYGEIINYNEYMLESLLGIKLDNYYSIDKYYIEYMKIKKLKNIDNDINEYIENKRKKD